MKGHVSSLRGSLQHFTTTQLILTACIRLTLFLNVTGVSAGNLAIDPTCRNVQVDWKPEYPGQAAGTPASELRVPKNCRRGFSVAVPDSACAAIKFPAGEKGKSGKKKNYDDDLNANEALGFIFERSPGGQCLEPSERALDKFLLDLHNRKELGHPGKNSPHLSSSPAPPMPPFFLIDLQCNCTGVQAKLREYSDLIHSYAVFGVAMADNGDFNTYCSKAISPQTLRMDSRLSVRLPEQPSSSSFALVVFLQRQFCTTLTPVVAGIWPEAVEQNRNRNHQGSGAPDANGPPKGPPTVRGITDDTHPGATENGEEQENSQNNVLTSFSKTSVLFVSVSFIILMVISLAWLVFYYVQRFRFAHAKDRMHRRLFNAAKKTLAKIPAKSLRQGDKELDCDCPVCIEPYRTGDVIRILPCKHIFHKSCVDPWLLEHRTCPMCKMDILKAYGITFAKSEDSVHNIEGDAISAGQSSLNAADVTPHSSGLAVGFQMPAGMTSSGIVGVESDIQDPFFPSPAPSPSLLQPVLHSGNARSFSIIPMTVHAAGALAQARGSSDSSGRSVCLFPSPASSPSPCSTPGTPAASASFP